MDLTKIKKVHIIGIGGIGISALAQFFVREGKSVIGSDNGISEVVRNILKDDGILVREEHSADAISSDIDLVVYSDAITEEADGFVELKQARKLGISNLSYFEALGEVTKNRFTVAVAGVHGKTTTSAMLTKILQDADKNPTAIIGSVVKDFGSNFVAGERELFVVEACEYKNHVLQLRPNILVITNIEWDHTDFFSDLSAMQDTFRRAVEQLSVNGVLVTDICSTNILPILKNAKCKVVDYTEVELGAVSLFGEFNEMNARAAVSAARAAYPDISVVSACNSLSEYKGSSRRFEYKGKAKNGAEVYDDYAHHPTAIRETLRTVKDKFKDKQIIVAFHPHLYSRTADLMDDFANAFMDADEVIIAPIYAARETPLAGVSGVVLSEKITEAGKKAVACGSLEEVECYLKKHTGTGDIVITMGAGDIYKVADALVT